MKSSYHMTFLTCNARKKVQIFTQVIRWEKVKQLNRKKVKKNKKFLTTLYAS